MFPAQDTGADPNREPDLEQNPDLPDSGMNPIMLALIPCLKNVRDDGVLVCVWGVDGQKGQEAWRGDREQEQAQDYWKTLLYPVLKNEWAIQLNFPENVNVPFHLH